MKGDYIQSQLPESSILIRASTPEGYKPIYKENYYYFFSSDKTLDFNGRKVPYAHLLRDSPIIYNDPKEESKTPMNQRQVGFIRRELPEQNMVLSRELRVMTYHHVKQSCRNKHFNDCLPSQHANTVFG